MIMSGLAHGRIDGAQSEFVRSAGRLTMAKLRLAGIHKSFDSTQALKDVSFSAQRGEVLALCGENGAGKSTLIRILSGAVQPDSGEIFLGDEADRIETPRRAIDLGIQHGPPGT